MIQIYFDDIQQTIVTELEKAKTEVLIALGWLSFDIYFDAFNSLLDRNVKVELILDNNSSNKRPNHKIQALIAKSISIKYITMPGQYGHMHHKFCIIDKETVISGSYNWSFNAATNFENIFIVKGEEIVVHKFSDEFDILKNITPQRLNSLQNLHNCPEQNCSGKLLNILVYGRSEEKYGEAVGDIVQFCSEEPYEHKKIVELSVINHTINRIADEIFYKYEEAYECYSISDDTLTEEKIAEINKQLDYYSDRRYLIYSNNHGFNVGQQNIIHGWGRIHSKRSGYKDEDEDFYVKIYWKDKFVKHLIADEYEDTFDIY